MAEVSFYRTNTKEKKPRIAGKFALCHCWVLHTELHYCSYAADVATLLNSLQS